MEIGTKVKVISEIVWGYDPPVIGEKGVVVPYPFDLRRAHLLAGEPLPTDEIAVKLENHPNVIIFFSDELEVID